MKSLFTAAICRLTLGIVLLVTITTASAQKETSTPLPAAAPSPAPAPSSPAVPAADPAVVKYQGTQDDMLVFNVSYSNPAGQKLVIQITDQNGNQLFQDIFRDKSFYRQFKLPKLDEDLITFVFRHGQDAPVQKRFAVNIDSHLIQEIAIKKL